MSGGASAKFDDLLRQLRRQYEIDVQDMKNQMVELEGQLSEYRAQQSSASGPLRSRAAQGDTHPATPFRDSPDEGAKPAPLEEVDFDDDEMEWLEAPEDSPCHPRQNGGSPPPKAQQLVFAVLKEWAQELVYDANSWGRDVSEKAVKEDVRKMVGGDCHRNVHRMISTVTGSATIEDPVSRFIIDPGSSIRMYWDVVVMFLTLYDLITVPLLTFGEDDTLFLIVMAWTALLFWTADIILSTFMGYYDKKGKLVLFRPAILRNYLRTWFVLDCIVVLPDWVMTFLGSTPGLGKLGKLLRVARVVRIFRLLRILKLRRLITELYDQIASEYTFLVVELVKMLCFIVMLNHWNACIWYGIGLIGKTAGADKNWLEHVGQTPVWDQSFAWKYTTSLHWSITQFTPASMDVSATNIGERVFSICILFWALVALSSFIGSVSAAMTTMRNMAGDRQKKFWLLRQYLKQRAISEPLKKAIVKYLEAKVEAKRSMIPEGKIVLLGQLSQRLANHLSYEANAGLLEVHKLFYFLSQKIRPVTLALCQHALKARDVSEHEAVFQAGECASDMYFVRSGQFQYQRSEELLECGVFFAEAALWTEWCHRGDLRCATEVGDIVVLASAALGTVFRSHITPFYYAKRYAEDFVKQLNNVPTARLTDVTSFDIQWLKVEITQSTRDTRRIPSFALKPRAAWA